MTTEQMTVLRALLRHEQREVKVDHRHAWDRDVPFSHDGATALFDRCPGCGGVGLFDVVFVVPSGGPPLA